MAYNDPRGEDRAQSGYANKNTGAGGYDNKSGNGVGATSSGSDDKRQAIEGAQVKLGNAKFDKNGAYVLTAKGLAAKAAADKKASDDAAKAEAAAKRAITQAEGAAAKKASDKIASDKDMLLTWYYDYGWQSGENITGPFTDQQIIIIPAVSGIEVNCCLPISFFRKKEIKK
jgi:hypothetical protein